MARKNGKWLPGTAGGGASEGGKAKAANKPYTEAAREMLYALVGVPAAWPKDRDAWTNAQELVERDMTRALAGDEDAAKRLVERAEGKVPSAPEDRESNEKAAASLGYGMSLIENLRRALRPRAEVEAIEVEILKEPDDPK